MGRRRGPPRQGVNSVASTAGTIPTPAGRPAKAAARLPAFEVAAVPWRSMADDIAAWEALALCAAEPNPFFESWHLLPALTAFDPEADIVLLRF